MPKKDNQKLRPFYLLRILSKETDDTHHLTKQQIMQVYDELGFTCTKKTFYSDLESLADLGYDIIKNKTFGNTDYFIGSREFTMPELKLLVDAVRSSKFITARKSDELIEKLSGLVSRYEAKSLSRKVYQTNSVKTINERIYYMVDDLHNAISDEKAISFRYFSFDSEKKKVYRKNGERYTVYPFTLVWDNENYYLVAYEYLTGITKHFRVDKMEDIKESGETKPEADFDATEYTKSMFNMFGGKETKVKLVCSNDIASVIIDRFGDDIHFYRYDRDHFFIHENIVVSDQFYAWLFGLGSSIKIESPASVADDFKNKVREMNDWLSD